MNDKPIGPLLGAWFKGLDTTPPDARDSIRPVMARLPEVHQRGRWWPLPSFESGPGNSVFSAAKFVVAAGIVALFGGFLLTGVLTTPDADEIVPAAVTASPSPETEAEREAGPTSGPTEARDPSVRTDILPGVELVAEEVEPGVLRVLNDGVRDLAYPGRSRSVSTGRDGSVWIHSAERSVRLGEPGALNYEPGLGLTGVGLRPSEFHVAPDGVAWVRGRSDMDRIVIASFDGPALEVHKEAPWTSGFRLDVAADGTVWAAWPHPEKKRHWSVGYLGPDGWHVLDEPVQRRSGMGLVVTDDGEVWTEGGSDRLKRFVDGAWQAVGPEPSSGFVTVGRDGTVWLMLEPFDDHTLTRFDGVEWQEWGPADGVPEDFAGPFLVGADGSLWTSVGDGVNYRDGVVRFDGTTWDHLLPGHEFWDMAVADDGSVWLLAYPDLPLVARDDDDDVLHLYVITPEAVTATE